MSRENPQFNEHEPHLSTLDLSGLKKEIDEYNSRFSAGVMMADMLKAQVRGDAPPNQDAESKKLPLERIKLQYGDLTERTGISLESVRGPMTIYAQDGEKQTSLLRINIADRKKYLTYLRTLEPDTIKDTQAQGITAVSESLTKQLAREYNLENPDDERMLQLLGGLDEITGEYERLDPQGSKEIGRSVENLKKYSEAAKEKYLREYLMVERANILLEVGGKNFGPSRRHTDSFNQYEGFWRDTIGVLKKIKENPNAKAFFVKVRDHLIASLRYAIDDLEQKEESHIKGSEVYNLWETARRSLEEIETV